MEHKKDTKIKWRRVFLLILIVISSYLIFTTPSTLSAGAFNFNTKSHYAFLAKGFLSGQLSLSALPLPALLTLPDPYNPIENSGLRLHDASLYHEKYYLYFGPLPVLAFFIPIKLLTNHFPTETLSVAFFLSLGFIINYILLIRIKEHFFPKITETEILFFGILLAFSTTAPFLLTRGLFYESAIASAYCAMSFALFFLYQCIVSQFSKIHHLLLFSFFIALTVAGRPNFAVVCLLLIPAVLICIIKITPRNKLSLNIVSLLLPAIAIAIGLALYNYLRFDSIFQFGEKYQLAGYEVSKLPPPLVVSFSHIKNILYLYFIQPFSLTNTFRHLPSLPHIQLGETILPKGQIPYYEPVSGVLMTSPVIIFILSLPILIKYYLKNMQSAHKSLCLFLFLTFLIPLTIIIFFTMCGLICATERYEMDFLPYMIFLSIVCFWMLQKIQLKSWLLTTTKIVFYTLGIISILIGVDIGITGYGV